MQLQKSTLSANTLENKATMPAHSDLTFITNENGYSLLERFKVLIKDTECFDVLVGYFYTSGFHALVVSQFES